MSRALAQIEVLNRDQRVASPARALEEALGRLGETRQGIPEPHRRSSQRSNVAYSAYRNCRATVRPHVCAPPSATVPISASSATASCSVGSLLRYRPGNTLFEGRAEFDKLAEVLIDLDKQIPSEIAWVLRVDGQG